jgi:hypothetical protein
MHNEASAAARLYFFTREDSLYENAELGTLPARSYGFTVNEHTSVEFGVLADGWSRGGLLGAILLSLAFCLIVLLLELASLKMGSLSPPSRMALTVVCMTAALQFNNIPFIAAVRSLILGYGVWLVFCLLISPIIPASQRTPRTNK